MFIFLSCDDKAEPDERINDTLQGEWEIISWTNDEEEFIGMAFQSVTYEFNKESPNGGTLIITRVPIPGGGTTGVFRRPYEVINDGTQLRLDEGDLNLLLDNMRLILSGLLDDVRVEIEGEKS